MDALSVTMSQALRGGSVSQQLRVLVVEDEPDLASVVAAYLRGEGFDVHDA